MTIQYYNRLCTGKTLIMGIVNCTPDSFSGDGIHENYLLAVDQAREMVEQGADIIDIGGESSRPGAAPVDTKDEITRTISVIRELRKISKVKISIDTTKAEVAEEAVRAGAEIINDISGMTHEPDIAKVAVENDCDTVIMHMKGSPKNMQVDPNYSDVVKEIIDYFRERIDSLTAVGIKKERIILDPGIGFGKTAEHNFEILKRLKEIKGLGYSVLIGTSRKSFIGKALGKETDARLWGTVASNVAAVMNGADIVRVHDVAEIKDSMMITDLIK